jgi:polyphenol oxidase
MRSAPDPVSWLTPQWPAPVGVRAAFTLRSGGVSAAPYDSLNVGVHVGDAAAAVSENRRRVREALRLPEEPQWLEQVHGTDVSDPDGEASPVLAAADAIIARRPGRVAVIQVADCLPVFFAAPGGEAVACAHAGWRGLAAGVLEATVRRLAVAPAALIAWLGPCIGPAHFEVGTEVRAAFLNEDAAAATAFAANTRGRWQCDLPALARRRLARVGVTQVFGSGWCTFAGRERFFSFRRDGRCGRMAALIWRE